MTNEAHHLLEMLPKQSEIKAQEKLWESEEKHENGGIHIEEG